MTAADAAAVTMKPAEVSKGDTVILNGEHRVVDMVIKSGETVFIDFAGYDTEDGEPVAFFMNSFLVDVDLSVIPAT